MKKIVSSILFLLSIQITIAQSKQEKEVAISVEQLRIAMVNADSVALNKLVSAKLSYGHSGGAIDDKKIFIEKLVSGKSDFVTIDLTEQTITVTKKIAIVRHTLTATTNDSGKPGTVNLKVLQVWHKQKGHWLFIARQAIKIQL
jgi:Domain of unknown function (DUF4440)